MNYDLLSEAVKCGMIDTAYIQEQIENMKRKELLERFPNKIWQGSDGWWNTYVPDSDGKRIRKKKKTLKEIEDIAIEYMVAFEDNPNLREIFNRWIDRRYELGKICIGTKERNTQLFNRHFVKIESLLIKNLTKKQIIDFLEEQVGEYNLTAKAFSNIKSITKGMLLYAKREGYLSWNIGDMLEELDVSDRDFTKRVKEDYEEVFNEEETSRMINFLSNNLDPKNIGILLMFLTGIRVGELVSLKHEDFNDYSFKIKRTETKKQNDYNKGHTYFVKEYPKTPAGIREMVIPKDYWWLISKIHSISPDTDYIFVENRERMTTNTIRRRLARNCDKLDIYKKSPHKIRKTYGTILMDNNIDKNMVTGLMGHTNINCSEQYYHRNRKSIDKKLNIISSLPDFKLKTV